MNVHKAGGEAYPGRYENWFTLEDEKEVYLRPITPGPSFLIVEPFKSLSPQASATCLLASLHRLALKRVHQLTSVDFKKAP